MNARLAAILVVLGVLLVGSATMFYAEQGARQASNVGTLGKPLLTGLKGAEVATIRMREPGASLTLEQKNGQWRIAERAGFPASRERVRDFVLLAIGLKIGQSEPIGEADRARLKLDATGPGMGTAIEFLDAAGKPLASLVAGAKYFRVTPDDPVKASADGRFVMRAADARTVYTVSDPLVQASTKSAGWIDTGGMAAERVKSLEVRPVEGERWKVERPDENTDWTIDAAAPAGMVFAVTRANAATYAMSLLDLADVAPADMAPAKAGLDAPTVVTIQTFDGLTYTLNIGKREGERHYAGVRVTGTLNKAARVPAADEKPADREKRDKEHAERLARLEARLPYEQGLAKHVLVFERIKLEDVLRKRADFFEKQEAKK